MSLTFRNVDAKPTDPVQTWPYEALVTAIERGTIGDWAHLTRSVGANPWGVVARQIEGYLSYQQPYGVGPLLERRIARARADAEERERAEVAASVASLTERSGLTLTELASRAGTSRSRLSTYRSGSVVPSAAFLVRLTKLVERIEAGRGSRT